MKPIKTILATAATTLVAATMFLATPAGAVVMTFGGGVSGTDALGDTWNTSNTASFFPAWGMPGVQAGWGVFNSADISNGNGSYATSLDVKFTGGTGDFTNGFGVGFGEILNPGEPYNFAGDWTTTFVSANEVRFDAPAGFRLNAGDQYFVFAEFTQPIDLSNFSFTATWSDGSAASGVPEAGSLWIFAGALLGFAGLFLRRRSANSMPLPALET